MASMTFTLNSPLTLNAGVFPFYTFARDVNGDGIFDLVTLNTGATGGSWTGWTLGQPSVSFSYGRPGGGYAAPYTMPAGIYGANPNGFIVADMDKDGVLDLVIANNLANKIGFYAGSGLDANGNPTYKPPVLFDVPNYPQAISAEDVNGDGYLDIISPNALSSFSILINDQNGSFAAATTRASAYQSKVAQTADVNGDGLLDIVIASNNDNNNTAVEIHYSTGLDANGAPDFSGAVQKICPQARGMAIGDLNNDGDIDIVSANFFSNSITIATNAGTDSGGLVNFQTTSLSEPGNPHSIYLIDLNADGFKDVVVNDVALFGGTPGFTVYLNDGTGGFAQASSFHFNVAHMGYNLSFEDLNADGVLDVMAPDANAGKVFVFLQSVTFGTPDADDLDASDNGTVIGLDGDDSIHGSSGSDSLLGGEGDDELVGGDGNDVLDGGAGTDTADYSESTSDLAVDVGTGTASGSDIGTDTLTGIESVLGGSGDDTISGGTRDDALAGGAGDDVLEGGAGNDSLTGGEGSDAVNYGDSASDLTIDLDAGTATGNDIGSDVLSEIEVVSAGSGDDSILGGAGDESLAGGLGADTIVGGSGDDAVNAGEGDDLIVGGHGEGNDTYVGGAGNDTVSYTSASAGITVNLAAAVNQAFATAGDDAAKIGVDQLSGIENLIAGNFDDVLSGTSVANRLEGMAGNDSLFGADGNDTLLGGADNDTLTGGLGSDVLAGGAGDDVYVIDGTTDTIVENADDGVDTVQTLLTSYTLAANLENWTAGGSAAISGTGNALNNLLTGNAAGNVLTGGAGNDTLFGAAGLDTLRGGTGEDLYVVELNASGTLRDVISESSTLVGEVDTVSLRGVSTNLTAVTLTLGTNLDILDASLTGGSLLNLTGNVLNNRLIGNDAANVLTGGSGADSMDGGNGSDIYMISAVSQYVAGESITDSGSSSDLDELRFATTTASTLTLESTISGVERIVIGTGTAAKAVTTATTAINVNASALTQGVTLVGNAGSNSLTGGGGDDTLTGGGGIDAFVVKSGTDQVADLGYGGADVLNVLAGATVNATVAAAWTSTASTVNLGTVNIMTAGHAVNLAALNAFGTKGFSVTNTSATATILTGSGLDDTLVGFFGNDTLIGNAGNDLLTGNGGNDLLVGGGGADTMDGGEGSDIYVIAAPGDLAPDEQVVDTGDETGIDELRLATTTMSSFVLEAGMIGLEKITIGTGTAGPAVTTGTVAIHVNAAALSDDLAITGNNGANVLTGGSGHDTLTGNAGVDTLNGGEGEDRLVGGLGGDQLSGGSGRDVFAFGAGSTGQTSNVDVIADYEVGAAGIADVIDYSAALSIGGTSAAATATQASIDMATGVASFAALSGTTLSDALLDISARFSAATNSAGEFAFFKVNNAGDYYLFISDGSAGIGSTDVVVRLTGLTVVNGIELIAGDLVISA